MNDNQIDSKLVEVLIRIQDTQEHMLCNIDAINESVHEMNERVNKLEQEVAETRGKTKGMMLLVSLASAAGGAGLMSLIPGV